MDIDKFINSPYTSLGMGILGGNYGPGSNAAFANAMKGGLLGMQQAGVSQARQAQTQMAQQQLLMQQARLKREKEEREQMEAWISTLPPEEQAMARGNPELFKVMMTQKYQQQYAPPTAPTAAPSDVRRFQYYQSLTYGTKRRVPAGKRAQQFLNLGNQFGVPSMTDPTQLTGGSFRSISSQVNNRQCVLNKLRQLQKEPRRVPRWFHTKMLLRVCQGYWHWLANSVRSAKKRHTPKQAGP